jgi:hypothetical protein
MLSREGITGVVCLAASLALLAATLGLPGPTLLVPVGPALYPRIILGITAALSIALIIADAVAQGRRAPSRAKPDAAQANYALVSASFATFGVYVAALPWLGFRVSTFIFLVALQAVLDLPRDRKRWIVVAAVALATTAITYYLFERYLLVLLPRGRWTDF